MHVEVRLRPRYFIKGRSASFGTAEKAYRTLAKKIIASEFEALGWEAEEGVASPALMAFRERWMFLAGEVWVPTKEYREEVRWIAAMLRAEDEAEAEGGK